MREDSGTHGAYQPVELLESASYQFACRGCDVAFLRGEIVASCLPNRVDSLQARIAFRREGFWEALSTHAHFISKG